MKIKKKVQGEIIELEFIKIKEYPKYSLYQIYKIKDNERTALYKECYTDKQIKDIRQNKSIIAEEVFE